MEQEATMSMKEVKETGRLSEKIPQIVSLCILNG